jgi:hypothetical protein
LGRPLPVIVTKRVLVKSDAMGGQIECKQLGTWNAISQRSVAAYSMVTACLVDSIGDITYGHAENNGRVCRAFAGADDEG